MARKVFVSFRYNDGAYYKEELCKRFDSSTEVIDRSEDQDRSSMSEATIKKYLYEKLRDTSVTIVLLTPNALCHQKDFWGFYDDWMYDEIRYSLEDREGNRTNGLIAVYTPEAENSLISKTTHRCSVCNQTKQVTTVRDINNLARKNMMNVYPEYKKNPCDGVFDGDWDSYCTLISWDEFISDYARYIDIAAQKRSCLNHYKLYKQL